MQTFSDFIFFLKSDWLFHESVQLVTSACGQAPWEAKIATREMTKTAMLAC